MKNRMKYFRDDIVMGLFCILLALGATYRFRLARLELFNFGNANEYSLLGHFLANPISLILCFIWWKSIQEIDRLLDHRSVDNKSLSSKFKKMSVLLAHLPLLIYLVPFMWYFYPVLEAW